MHYKQNNKESRTHVQGLRAFGNTLPRGLKGILKKNGYNYSEIVSKWNFLVGNEISSCSYPKSIKIKKENKNGLLILAVKRGDEITVEYSKVKIVNKINSYFGYKLIDQIKIETFNSEINRKNKNIRTQEINSKKFEKKISDIKNNNLKSSLLKLLHSMKNG